MNSDYFCFQKVNIFFGLNWNTNNW